MITAKGIGFLVAAIALFLLARLTQVGWLYLVDAVLWGLIILSAVGPWVGTAFLTASRKVEHSGSTKHSPGPSEGDQVQIALSLRNRSPWPCYVLGLFYDCAIAAPADRMLRFFVTQVTRSGQVSMVSNVQAYQRGKHQLGPVVAESSAPFGLFRRRVRLTGSQLVLVYPQVYPLKQLPLAECLSGAGAGAHKSRTGTDQAGSRQYLPGDPRRLIHWRNSARTGRLMVRELEEPVDRTLHLLFDATKVWGEGRENTLEYGIKVVASIANYACRNQIPVQVLGGGLGHEATQARRKGEWHHQKAWPQLSKDLASVTQGEGRGLVENLRSIPAGSSAVVAVSSEDLPGLEATLRVGPSLRQLVVVLLEGFGETGIDDERLGKLRATKAQIIACRPGQLRESLQLLEGADGTVASAIGTRKTRELAGMVSQANRNFKDAHSPSTDR